MSAPFVAADVGGTHVRIGWIDPCAGDIAHLGVRDAQRYRCADYPSLSAILAEFLGETGRTDAMVIASAGYPLADGTVITANLPWRLSPRQIQQDLGVSAVHLVNDFEAVAHAAAYVDDSQVLQLTGPQQHCDGPLLVLGPGTGLGAAVWIPNEGRPVVLATEAGQAALAVRTPLEMQLLAVMLAERGHVCVEQALSGPGLLNLYNALCTVRGSQSQHASPDQVTAAADAGDAVAAEALQVFCGLLGSVVGDMALLYGAQGGIYLAGGILPKIRQHLMASNFVERFLDKGPMREALQRIPVKLVEHGMLGVVGAAHWYIGRHALHASAPPHYP